MASGRGCEPEGVVLSSTDAAERDASASPPDPSRTNRTFPRSCRLTSRKQYQEVYERGRRSSSKSMTVFALPNELAECRLGITVTRKVGGAAVRNRFKRLIREAFRANRDDLQPALDLVVNARRGVEARTREEIEIEFMGRFRVLARRFAS